MTAKEYLARAYHIDRKIDAKLLEACRLRAMAEGVASAFPSGRVKGGGKGRQETATLALCGLEEEITGEIQSLVAAKRSIEAVIQRVDDPTLQDLLRLRYLCFLKWEAIAVRMHYSWRNVHYRHRDALAAVGKVCTLLHTDP